jgi:hypothetical protein
MRKMLIPEPHYNKPGGGGALIETKLTAVFRINDILVSESADPCLCLMDPDADPDPAIFVIDLQDTNKKLIKKKFFLLISF